MSATEKLYYTDRMLSAFTAHVLDCQLTKDNRFAVTLERTAFFPESGGQPGDTGSLNGQPVFNTKIADKIITHIVGMPLEIGSTVEGTVNIARRFRFMQNHTGEHILSGLIHAQYGGENVGFHCAENGEVTIDQNIELSAEQLSALEEQANAIIFQSLPIIVTYPTQEELQQLSFRSKLELKEDVRIVTIPGVDCCACCAVHVETTAQVGLLKITDFMRYKGGTRMHIRCGYSALDDYRLKLNSVTRLSQMLSAKPEEVVQATRQKCEELDGVKRTFTQMQKQAVLQKCAAISPTEGNLCLFEEGLDANTLRQLADGLQKKCRLCGVFCGDEQSGYRFVLASQQVNLRQTLPALQQKISIKGGGSPQMMQGQTAAQKQAITDAILAL